jgi:hypothetical protein
VGVSRAGSAGSAILLLHMVAVVAVPVWFIGQGGTVPHRSLDDVLERISRHGSVAISRLSEVIAICILD